MEAAVAVAPKLARKEGTLPTVGSYSVVGVESSMAPSLEGREGRNRTTRRKSRDSRRGNRGCDGVETHQHHWPEKRKKERRKVSK